ncbi:MAG: ATP-binding protein [Candidatus Moranbacteria bacterium]|nr:ATP-binding protein [Candidatus Moranbacteria bacterium]
MKRKATFTNKSIDQIGLPRDYKKALSEYIRNGFEAGATRIDINFSGNVIGHVDSLEIKDNGFGIEYDNLDQYFGYLLDSHKQRDKNSSFIYGGKGKGRLSFQVFSRNAVWETVYKIGDKFYKYDIAIKDNERDYYDPSNKKECNEETGTTVKFKGLFGVTIDKISSSEFIEYLKYEFGWFLFLNKGGDVSIFINNKKLDYNSIIADSEVVDEEIGDYKFKISYIRWDNKIGEDSFYHFLCDDLREKYREHTGFNKIGGGAYGFFHSVYIQSDYFDNFNYQNVEKSSKEFFGKNQSDDIFKSLVIRLRKYLSQKRDNFYRLGADKKLKEFQVRKVVPEFREDKYDQERKRDFETVFKEIYLIEPMVFQSLKPLQEKSLLAMLNLLLESDERENILKIIDGIVCDLNKEERKRLANTLTKTSFNNIVRAIKMIEERFDAIETIKTLVFDLKKFTTERDHIQKIIESNYWLFGEQFHLTSADESFEKMLSNYRQFIDGNPSAKEKKKFKLNGIEKLRRPDIFICRSRKIPDIKSNDDSIEENIIVELKRPSVVIDKEQYRQIEDYFDFILEKDEFKSVELRKWKFFIVGNDLTEEVRNKYVSFEKEGKKFLVNKVRNFEIYALTWDDLFKGFELRHEYLLEKLNFDKASIQEELKNKGIDLNIESVRLLSKSIIEKVE